VAALDTAFAAAPFESTTAVVRTCIALTRPDTAFVTAAIAVSTSDCLEDAELYVAINAASAVFVVVKAVFAEFAAFTAVVDAPVAFVSPLPVFLSAVLMAAIAF